MLRAPAPPGKRNGLPSPAGRDTMTGHMNRYRKFLLAAGLLIALIGTGCQGLTSSSGKSTAIFGRVVDPAETGIREIQVAVVFEWVNRKPETGLPGPLSAAPVEAAAPAAGVTLDYPYPNPAYDLVSRPVTVRVQTDRDTTAKIEIWSVLGGVPTTVRTLLNGSLSGTTGPFHVKLRAFASIARGNGIVPRVAALRCNYAVKKANRRQRSVRNGRRLP